ncbi:hypothetical protein SLS56_000334 [Neofusicoccum ribis]|uniref:Uncharacterized protein n=1 Tax=Neofusicoccum ribis TaxID=45134 RepID=A0ABR3TEE0_9PEZI
MLGDAQLDASEAQIRSFRMMNGQYYETLQEILRKYENLVDDYRMLRSDYEEEKENREKYKRQARGQEKNPFVLLLVDGDGYLFKDHLVSNGREGGVSAAKLLSTEIRSRLRKMGLDHCRMVVRIYCNLAVVSQAHYRAGLCGSHVRSMAPIAAAFSGAKDYFDFVDIGENSGSVVAKVEENFRLFADSGQCKHIFFAGCHNTRYIPLLSPYLGKADKISLVKAAAHQPEYHSLGLPMEDFSSVFRDSPLSGWSPGTTTIKGAATKQNPPRSESVSGATKQPLPRPESVNDINGMNGMPKQHNDFSRLKGAASTHLEASGPSSMSGDFDENGWCKFGHGCKFDHPSTGKEAADGSPFKTKAKDTSGNWRNVNAFADDWGNNAQNTPEPAYADDWGASSKKPQQDFAEDWGKAPKGKRNPVVQSKFADDSSRPSTSGFAEDWGKGPQQNSRAGSISNHSVASRIQRRGSISEVSMGSRHQEDTKPHPSEALSSRWASDAPEPPQVKEPTKKFNSAFTTAADLPRPSPETEGLIPVNKYGDRLDFYLSRPTAEEYAAYNAMTKEPGKKPCNDYQLKGHCSSLAAGLDCEYDHNPLSTELFHVLKVIVQAYPCPQKGDCRKSDCPNGHVCQRPGCRGQVPCRFKNDYRAHNLDPKVHEWVPAIDIEERESDDSASVTMGEAVPEPKPKPITSVDPDVNTETVEWHPESAAWNPDAVDWKPHTAGRKSEVQEWRPETSNNFDLNSGTSKLGNANWNPSASAWKPSHVDRSDIDSDSDSIAHQPEKEILDLGADDAMTGSIFSSKAHNGRLDSVVQTGDLVPKVESKPLVDTPPTKTNGNSSKEEEPAKQPETNLMDDDWGNPPDGAGTFAETAEPVNFDDDWGSAPPGVDNPSEAAEPVDFADDWGPSTKAPKAKTTAPPRQNRGGNYHGGQAPQNGMLWPSEIQKQQQQRNEYDHLLWVRTVD